MSKYHFNYSRESKRNRIRKLLCDEQPQIVAQFLWDDEALWSLTPLRIGDELCQRLLRLGGINANSVITDAMASVGGNTISFSRHFSRVNAIELNARRKSMLDHNIRLLGLRNITTYRGYYHHMNLQQDIVFFDPPWGIDYKKHAHGTMRMTLFAESPIPLEEYIIRFGRGAKYFMVKLPNNYDFAYFAQEMRKVGRVIGTMEYGRPNSFTAKIVRLDV